MAHEVQLVVEGVDLRSDEEIEKIGEVDLGHLAWTTIDGLVLVSVWVESNQDVVCQVADAANEVENRLSGARVLRVHDDLLSITDISARIGVSRETVRTWVSGERGPGGFPCPRGTVGGGPARAGTHVWTWRDAARWLQQHYRLTLDEPQLTEAQVAEINHHLTRAGRVHLAPGWESAPGRVSVQETFRVTTQHVVAVVPTPQSGVYTFEAATEALQRYGTHRILFDNVVFDRHGSADETQDGVTTTVQKLRDQGNVWATRA